jgi:hypothetical protein
LSRREQDAGARNIQSLPIARFFAAALVQDPEADVALDRKSIGVPAVGR